MEWLEEDGLVEDDVGQREKEHAPLVLYQEDDREKLTPSMERKGATMGCFGGDQGEVLVRFGPKKH
jgi:hypothetical protein